MWPTKGIGGDCGAGSGGRVLAAMRRHPRGEDATIIGTVGERRAGLVTMKTALDPRALWTCWRGSVAEDLLKVVC